MKHYDVIYAADAVILAALLASSPFRAISHVFPSGKNYRLSPAGSRAVHGWPRSRRERLLSEAVTRTGSVATSANNSANIAQDLLLSGRNVRNNRVYYSRTLGDLSTSLPVIVSSFRNFASIFFLQKFRFDARNMEKWRLILAHNLLLSHVLYVSSRLSDLFLFSVTWELIVQGAGHDTFYRETAVWSARASEKSGAVYLGALALLV